jgi:hypothetical protein
MHRRSRFVDFDYLCSDYEQRQLGLELAIDLADRADYWVTVGQVMIDR